MRESDGLAKSANATRAPQIGSSNVSTGEVCRSHPDARVRGRRGYRPPSLRLWRLKASGMQGSG